METNFAYLYTDESYLSKRELQTALKTTLVDTYWKAILNYRKDYQVPLGFRAANNKPYYLVLTPGIKKKIEDCFASLARLVNQVKKANSLEMEKALEKVLLFPTLSGVNETLAEENRSSDLAIKALINGTFRDSLDGKDKDMYAFNRTLSDLLNKEPTKNSDDFVAEIYGELLGERDALTKWYRLGNFDNRIPKNYQYEQNAVFPYAPAERIEPMMEEFGAFTEKEDLIPPLAKALVSLFYLVSVKPFESKNEEIATFFALNTLAFEGGLGKEAFLLPLSKALLKEPLLEDEYFIGAQKAGDLTYYLLRSINTISELASSLKNELDDLILASYEKEARYLSEEEEKASKKEAEDQKEVIQGSLFEDEIEEKEEEPSKEVIPPTQSEEKKQFTTLLPQRKEKPVPTISKEEMLRANNDGVIAIKKKESPLSDKEIKEYARYLLESDYSLNKTQASFLANHCIVGHYYSIQQYKKFARCAYETARTSMEKLAKQGYYKKLQVKNKFVYTPVEQTDKH